MIRTVFLAFTVVCVIGGARSAPQTFNEAKMPQPCEGKSYCYQKSDEYPQELVDNILKDLDRKIVEGFPENEIEDRVGDNDPPENDCDKDINFNPIYEILDEAGLVRFVIQSKENFKQEVRTEACLNPGRILKSSRYFEDHQLEVWNLSCYEKRVPYWFQVLSIDGNSLETVQVKGGIPVCCSCRLEN